MDKVQKTIGFQYYTPSSEPTSNIVVPKLKPTNAQDY
jgi:hypothetical protein